MDKETFTELIKTVRELGTVISKESLGILQKGISAGTANGALGLLSLMAYVDLLHGGPYRWGTRIAQLPYYTPEVQNQLGFTTPQAGFFLSALGRGANITVPGGVVSLPLGASTLQAEVILNGDVPRTLPKLLSDQAYIQIMERAGQLLNTVLLQNIGTGVSTFVEGITAGAERLMGAGGGEIESGAVLEGRAALVRANAAARETEARITAKK
jgi:hypothetical protein